MSYSCVLARIKGNRPNARRVVSQGSGSSDTQSFSDSGKSDSLGSGGSGGAQTDSLSNGLSHRITMKSIK